MLTSKQITWASKHEWFVGINLDGTITVRDEIVDRKGVVAITVYTWDGTFEALRAWAGY